MANIAVLLLVLLLALYISAVLRRKVHGLVPRRGIGVASDLGTLADKPRVRVRQVTRMGPDRVHLVLTSAAAGQDGDRIQTSFDLALVVSLSEQDHGDELLHEWKLSGQSLAIVLPPGSHLVRLRSIDDLQPLTLRRVDEAAG